MANVYDELSKKAAQRAKTTTKSNSVYTNSNREAAKAAMSTYDIDALIKEENRLKKAENDYKKITTPTLVNGIVSTPLERGEVEPNSPLLVNPPKDKIVVEPEAYDLAMKELRQKEKAEEDAEKAALLARAKAEIAILENSQNQEFIDKAKNKAGYGSNNIPGVDPITSYKINKAVENQKKSEYAKKLEKEKKIYTRTYLETLNAERKNAGLPAMDDAELKNYISMLEENRISFNDPAYIKNEKRDNLKYITLTYGAILNDNFAKNAQIGANISSEALSGSGLKEIHDIINGNKEVSDGAANRIYTMLNDTEKQVWNYYIGSQHSKKAIEYVNSMMPVLEDRLARQRAAEYDEQGAWGDLKEGAQAVLGGLESGTKNMFNSILGTAEAFGYKLSPLQARGFRPSYTEKLTNYVLSDESGNDGIVKNIIYKALNSMSYQVPSLLITAAGGGMAAFTAQSIGANTTEGIRSGNNSIANVVYGVYEGAMEYAVDKLLGGVSSQIAGKGASGLTGKLLNKIDNVIKTPKINKLLSKAAITVSTMGSEFFEEFIQTIAEPAARGIIYGETMDYSWETVANALEAGLIGAISGGLMGVTQVNRIKTQHDFETFGKNLLETGKADSIVKFAKDFGTTDSSAYESVKSAMENKNDIEPTDIAQLYIEAKQSFDTFSEADAAKFMQKTASEVDKDTLATVFFDGNTEAAEKFIKKYSNMNVEDVDNSKAPKAEMPSVILGTANDYGEVESAVEANKSVTEKLKGITNIKKLSKLSAANKKVDPVQKSINAATGTKEYTADQNELKKIGQQFGAKVRFENLTKRTVDENGNEVIFSPEGQFDPYTNTITLNTDVRPEHRPALFILKHELSHSLEKSGKEFEKFVGEVETSDAFEQYAKTRKNSRTGKNYTSLDEWYEDIADRYKKAGKPLGNENITERTAAKYEAVADFVGDMLFTGDTKTAEQFLKGLSLESQKGFIEAVKRFFAKLKAIFSGDAELTEIERLEKQFLEVANKVAKMNKAETEQQKTTTEEGSENNIVDTQSQKSYSIYDEYATNLMIWANSAETKVGDIKILPTRKGFALFESTGNGNYIVLEQGSYKEVKKEYERAYNNADNEIYGNTQSIRADKGRDIWDLQSNENGRNDIANIRQTREKRVSNNSARNNENLRRGDKGKQSVKYSLSTTDRTYLNAVEKGDMETAQKMVDEAAKAKGYTFRGYHGTNAEYSVINNNLEYGLPFFVTSDEKSAKTFGGHELSLYGRAEKPLVLDAEGKHIHSAEFKYRKKQVYITELLRLAKQDKYDCVVVKNTFDSLNGSGDLSEVYVFFYPEKQIKSADPVTYDDNGNVIPLSERFESENNDIRYSLPENPTPLEIGDAYKNGEITAEEYERLINQSWDKQIKQEGEIEQGEMVAPPNKPNPTPTSVKPNTKVSEHIRTILESGYASKEMETYLKEKILDGLGSFTPTSNEKDINKAARKIQKQGYQNALNTWRTGLDGLLVGSHTVAQGEALLRLAMEQNNAVDIVNISADLAELSTRTAQSLQAFSLLKRMGGIGQLVYIQRSVNKLNQDLQKRSHNKADIVKVDKKLAERLAKAETEGEYEVIYNKIMQDVADQVPATFLDKWNAWRYMAMLFNPTTHVRNVSGNAIFVPAVRMKDLLALAGEKAFVKQENRTKSLKVKKEYQDFASKDFEQVKSLLTGTGKYNPTDDIKEHQKIFKNKVLEGLRRLNFNLLEAEDALFLKRHYRHALGGFLQARKLDLNKLTQKQLTEARNYAFNEALKATYRDASMVANMISQLSKSKAIANVLVEGVLPFKKTPINILKRGLEYSPIGLVKTLSSGLYQLKTGKITAAQFIDGIAAGLTGTGITILGAFLASLGIIKGGFDDEETLDRLMGKQEYSVQIGNKSYTIDWAAPASIPFFMGVAAQEYKPEEDGDFLTNLYNFGIQGFEPILNLSMLSGINDVINSVSYAESNENLPQLVGAAIGSYFSQLLPTIFGKTANVIDNTRRMKYIDKTSNVPELVQSALNKIYAKTPWLSKNRAEYIDAWGETKYTGNFFERFFQQFVSPGYASTVDEKAISEEALRLYRETGDKSVIPSTPAKYFEFNKTRRDLSKEEYFDYATLRGQMQADIVSEAINSEAYKKLNDEQKALVFSTIYSFANAYAKTTLKYSYEEVAAMVGKDKNEEYILTKEKWDKLDDKAKRLLVNDKFFNKKVYEKAYKAYQKGESVSEVIIKQVLKDTK